MSTLVQRRLARAAKRKPKKTAGRVVKMRRAIEWEEEVTIPETCPECDTEVVGFDGTEAFFGRCMYDEDGEAIDHEFPDGSGQIVEVKCNACGHALVEEMTATATTADAIKTAATFAAVLSDTAQEARE